MKRLIIILLSLLLATGAYAADTSVPNMTEDTTPGTDSLVYTVDDPGGTPLDRRVTLGNLSKGLIGIDEAFGAGWDSDSGIPEKDDIHDWGVVFDSDYDGTLTDETWFDLANISGDSDDVTEGSTNLYVTAANVGGVSANLDDTDASIEWEDAGDLDADGNVNETDLAALRGGITGIVKGAGDGGGYSAATAGTDYTTPSSSESFTNKTYDAGGTGNVHVHEDTATAAPGAGGIELDTTDDQLVYDASGTDRVVTYKHTECYTLEDPVDADDDIPIFIKNDAITVNRIDCIVSGGTSAQILLNDGTNFLDTVTCGTTVTSDSSLSNNTFTALEAMYADVGTVNGAVDWVNFCFEYEITAE